MGKSGKKKSTAPRVGDRPFTQVELRAFVHATEDLEKVREALAFAAGFDLDEQKDSDQFLKQLTESSSEGHFRNPITILELPLKRAAQVRRFWDRLLADGAIRTDLAHEAPRRLDEELAFWFRLDKQEAVSGRLRLAPGEDVVRVRAKLATFPKDRQTGLAFLRRLFEAPEPKKLL